MDWAWVVLGATLFEMWGCGTFEKTAELFEVVIVPIEVVGGGGADVVGADWFVELGDDEVDVVDGVLPGRCAGHRPRPSGVDGPCVELDFDGLFELAAAAGTEAPTAAPIVPRPISADWARFLGV